jgi:hypothetical protein
MDHVSSIHFSVMIDLALTFPDFYHVYLDLFLDF